VGVYLPTTPYGYGAGAYLDAQCGPRYARLYGIDCTHWQLLEVPKDLGGQYQRRKGKRSAVAETVRDENLYIWHLFVECPGAYNNMNVLASSPRILDVNAGDWTPRRFNDTLNGRSCRFFTSLPTRDTPGTPYLLFRTRNLHLPN